MAENTQRPPTAHEALNLIDQWLAKLSGPGFDRNAHIQMQAAVQIVQHALPTEGAVEPEVLSPKPTPPTP
tara:strand:+ start:507 stop:716 length:210 start_codon:yes stop_codon:yes gene_type:complete